MENKKILNRIIILINALIIITFAVFYKQVSNINTAATWFKVLYFGILYASIICSGVGLIICFMNAFKDQFDLVWFVQFLNVCAFALILVLTLLFAIFEDVAINIVFLVIVCEYFAVNLIGTIIFICTNFKYFKKDFASLFKSGEPDKSYRYGLEEEKPKKSKAEKYALLENNTDEKTEDIPAEPIEEKTEDEPAIAEDEEMQSIENETTEENEQTENEDEQEITKEEAQELSDTITDTEDNSKNQLAEIENSIEVQKLIKENEEATEAPEEEDVKVYDEDEVKIAKGSKKLSKISDDDIVVTMEATPTDEPTEAETEETDDLEDRLPLDEDSTIPENEKYSEISEESDSNENKEKAEEEIDYDKQISREILENRKEEKISKLSKLIKNK